MNVSEDVNYTFRDSPKFLSPKRDEHMDIDETGDEVVNPSDAVLSKVASRFSPKKKSIFDKMSKISKMSPKRRRSKNPKSPKSPKSSKRTKSPKRRRSRKKSKKGSRKKSFGFKVMSGMGGLAY